MLYGKFLEIHECHHCPFLFLRVLMVLCLILGNNSRVLLVIISAISRVFSSAQCSSSVVFDSLQPHELQHARPPCPLPAPGIHPNPCPLSWWCHPTNSSFVVPFSSCPQSFPASGSFQISQFFASGGQSIRVSASTSVLPMNTQDPSHPSLPQFHSFPQSSILSPNYQKNGVHLL